jgi:3-hydroxyisobutyrate dehydrogenase-like beta-hydroxyacid dehydrogenase
MRVGWVGLGSIGTEMVKRLLAAGHEVTAYARGAGKDEATSAGAALRSDYAAVAADCDMLGVCVFNDAQVEDVLLASGALAAMRPGAVLAIHTTGSPSLARHIAQAAPAGVEVLDACFSGGPHDAAEARLTLMIGGTDTGVARARPAFESYAGSIFHVGPSGAGQTAKLLNNLLFATNLRMATRVMELASEQGLDARTTAEVIRKASGGSMAMGIYQSGRTPDQVMASVKKYIAKDVVAAEAAATAIDLDFSLFEPILDFYR